MTYSISFKQSAENEIKNLDAKIVKRIFIKIISLAKDPRPDGCKKLSTEENYWRIRVGDYRVVYSVNDKNKDVKVMYIKHRSNAY